MKRLLFAFTMAALALLAACGLRGLQGDGHLTTDNRSVADFTTVDAAGGLDITWSSGSSALAITTDQNLLPHIKTEVMGSKLRIFTDQTLSPTRGIKIILSSSALADAVLTGAIHLTANHVGGPAERLALTSSGAATIEVSGIVAKLSANLTGASTLKAAGLDAQEAAVNLVGASHADLAVARHLKASIVGAGSVTYAGSPSVEQSVTGAGSIRRRK